MIIKESKDLSFEEWVKNKRFPSDSGSGRKVQFKSLNRNRQNLIRSQFNKKREREREREKGKGRERGLGTPSPKSHNISEHAEIMDSHISENSSIKDNAKIRKSKIYDSKIVDADIQNAIILSGTWDKGQKVTKGFWSKEYDQKTIDFLDKNFKKSGDAPIRMMSSFLGSGGKTKPGLFRSKKKILKKFRKFVHENSSWRTYKEDHLDTRPFLDDIEKLDEDGWDNLISLAEVYGGLRRGKRASLQHSLLKIAAQDPHFRRQLIRELTKIT